MGKLKPLLFQLLLTIVVSALTSYAVFKYLHVEQPILLKEMWTDDVQKERDAALSDLFPAGTPIAVFRVMMLQDGFVRELDSVNRLHKDKFAATATYVYPHTFFCLHTLIGTGCKPVVYAEYDADGKIVSVFSTFRGFTL